jgi:hypothetical protein
MTPTTARPTSGDVNLRHEVILTVADHDKNGFVHLARWPNLSEIDARAFIGSIDGEITDDSEPDIKTASHTFILDLWDGRDLIDNGKRLLPMQVAMSLAPDQVQDWLNERPEPDSVIRRPVPLGPIAALSRAQPEKR